MPQNGADQYPAQGWSTGNMRKAGQGPMQSITPEEWQDFSQNTVWGFKPDQTVGVYAHNEADLKDYLKGRPDGFVTSKDHPGLKGIKNSADVYAIPQPGFEDAVFVKVKPGPEAKMLPTSSQAGQVIEQGAKQSRSKRKEAEAM